MVTVVVYTDLGLARLVNEDMGEVLGRELRAGQPARRHQGGHQHLVLLQSLHAGVRVPGEVRCYAIHFSNSHKLPRLVPQIDPSVKLYNHGEGPY